MTAIDRNEQKSDAARDDEGTGDGPAPASQPPRPARNKSPSDGQAIAELGDELGGPA